MKKRKTTAEKGKFKQEIHAALYNNADIRELILGDTNNMTPKEIRDCFKEHVKSHLYVDDTITDAGTYIFYDVIFPTLKAQTKVCEVVMYLMCQRQIIDNYYKDGYYGDRIDCLSQMVEDSLINNGNTAYSFGIGALSLDSVEIYNTTRFYGTVLIFSVPDFR